MWSASGGSDPTLHLRHDRPSHSPTRTHCGRLPACPAAELDVFFTDDRLCSIWTPESIGRSSGPATAEQHGPSS
jgi:hypothetical protein